MVLLGFAPVLAAAPVRAEEIYLTEEEAPAAVFPEADRFERWHIAATPELRDAVKRRIRPFKTTIWESRYPAWTAYGPAGPLGRAIVVEEIGKHRAITFVVGVDPEGEVAGVAVMAYREPYGGQVRSRRFLKQYEGKSAADPLLPSRDIRNITGATLSARAIGRGVKKAIAVLDASAVREAGDEREMGVAGEAGGPR